jgi:hypothetical protein
LCKVNERRKARIEMAGKCRELFTGTENEHMEAKGKTEECASDVKRTEMLGGPQTRGVSRMKRTYHIIRLLEMGTHAYLTPTL